MEQRKREEYKELNNPNHIASLSGSLLCSEYKAVFYKTIHGFNFYTIDNHITYKTNDFTPRYIIVGQVGVSDNKMIFEDFKRVMDYLGMEYIFQRELPLF